MRQSISTRSAAIRTPVSHGNQQTHPGVGISACRYRRYPDCVLTAEKCRKYCLIAEKIVYNGAIKTHYKLQYKPLWKKHKNAAFVN